METMNTYREQQIRKFVEDRIKPLLEERRTILDEQKNKSLEGSHPLVLREINNKIAKIVGLQK